MIRVTNNIWSPEDVNDKIDFKRRRSMVLSEVEVWNRIYSTKVHFEKDW